MKRRTCAGLVLASMLAACIQQGDFHLSRFDNKPIDRVTQEQATTECNAKAVVAANSVTQYQGSSLAGIASLVKEEETKRAAFTACMAEKGMKATWVPK